MNWINEPGRVFVARRGRSELTTTILGEAQVRDPVERMLKTTGRRVDLSTPFVDAMLPDGSRLHVVIPDITRRHWSVNIRKFVLSANTLDELVMLGTVTDQAARFLEAAIGAGLNVIVAGGTQAGKTTLLNCLAGAIPAKERVVTCEEVFELQLGLPDVVAMQTRQPNLEGTGEIRLRRLVKEALRMRPDRLLGREVDSLETSVDLGPPLVSVLAVLSPTASLTNGLRVRHGEASTPRPCHCCLHNRGGAAVTPGYFQVPAVGLPVGSLLLTIGDPSARCTRIGMPGSWHV